MKLSAKILWFFCSFQFSLCAQSNFMLSRPEVFSLLKGQFSIDSFDNRQIIPDQSVVPYLLENLSSDSLYAHLKGIVSYFNRNTIFDDPNQPDKGIRGARTYIHNKLMEWAAAPNAQLIPCEFTFDYLMCQRLSHTQLFAVIPGTGQLRNEMVIVEAHLDSRCEQSCDTVCLAQGADDNGSGSALVMELARVLSKVKLNRSLILMWTTGEEQGLGGARAFASYCKQNGIVIKAVFNNDIVGGIECGITSSPPGCPGPGLKDSLRVRLFSAGLTNSMPKSLARMTRILIEQNLEKIYPETPKVDVMFGEDRSGRGGDHIPFREQGYTAIRITSSYENGDGNPSQPGYEDRQHTSKDIIGFDLDGDLILDSLFVNFPYLRHNGLLNAMATINSASNAMGTLELKLSSEPGQLNIDILNPPVAKHYLYGIRRLNNAYFDTLIISPEHQLVVQGLLPSQYYVSAAPVDENEWIGMFSQEYNIRIPSATGNEISDKEFVELLQNKPNPFDELTVIPIIVHNISQVKSAQLSITNETGKPVKELMLDLVEGVNEIYYNYAWHGYTCGIYFYHLIVNGKKVASRKMLLSAY